MGGIVAVLSALSPFSRLAYIDLTTAPRCDRQDRQFRAQSCHSNASGGPHRCVTHFARPEIPPRIFSRRITLL